MNGGRKGGGKRNRWEDNINKWTGLRVAKSLKKAKYQKPWREVIEPSVSAPLQPPEVMGWLQTHVHEHNIM